MFSLGERTVASQEEILRIFLSKNMADTRMSQSWLSRLRVVLHWGVSLGGHGVPGNVLLCHVRFAKVCRTSFVREQEAWKFLSGRPQSVR